MYPVLSGRRPASLHPLCITAASSPLICARWAGKCQVCMARVPMSPCEHFVRIEAASKGEA